MLKRAIEFCLTNAAFIHLITLVVVGLGIWSFYDLKRELFPNVDFDNISVSTNYPGSSAEDVEKLITIPLEREVSSVSGIEELNALSGEGFSVLNLKIDPNYDLDEVLNEVRNAVAMVTDLPDEALVPTIKKFNNKQRAILKAAIIGGTEDLRRAAAKEIQNELEQQTAIARIELDGYRARELEIAVDLDKLKRWNLSLLEIVDVIRDRQINLSAGNVKGAESETLIRTLNDLDNVERVNDIVLRSNFSGETARVRDLAKVSFRLVEGQDYDRVNGKKAIFANVVAQSTADVIEVSDTSKQIIENILEEKIYKNAGIEVVFVDELAFFIKRRLGIVTENGLQGLLLVVICLLAFLNWRVALITTFGAPLAFLVAFILMSFSGMTLNLISMMGILLVLGMLVDDAIIVSEQFFQFREQGFSPGRAARLSANKTLPPVTGTIITTMMAFGAMFFLEGIWGKFLWPIPAVVFICLSASWLECFFILPGHLADFSGKGKIEKKRRWYYPLQKSYLSVFKLALRHSGKTLVFFLVLFGGAIYLFQFQVKKEMFPPDDVRTVILNLKATPGLPLEKTDKALQVLEKIIEKETTSDERDSFRSTVGRQQGQGRVGSRSGGHYGSMILHLEEQYLRDRTTDEILEAILSQAEKTITTHKISTIKLKGGPKQGAPVDIEIRGGDLATLTSLAKKVETELKNRKGIVSTEIDFEEGKEQLIVKVNELAARRLGVQNQQLALELRSVYQGLEAAKIVQDEEDVPIMVRANITSRRLTQKTLNKVNILTQSGLKVPLKSLVSLDSAPGAFVIRRKGKKRAISVFGDIDSQETNALSVATAMMPYIEELKKKNPGVQFSFEGERKETQETTQDFARLAILTLSAIFLLLVAMFGNLSAPFVIILAIPFGMIGVIFTFWTMDKAVGFMALMGIIGLLGVVVNDSIVLVTCILSELRAKKSLLYAVFFAAKSRFRAVILTTFTTVAGLLPIAHADGGDPFLKPMALSFAYGLIFSTTLTLLLVPISFYVLQKLASKFRR